jgi:CheY-like chemotaxis protein
MARAPAELRRRRTASHGLARGLQRSLVSGAVERGSRPRPVEAAAMIDAEPGYRPRTPRSHLEHGAWRRRARILLVEADAGLRHVLTDYLRRTGYAVIEAADGDAALDWLGPGALEGEPQRVPDLVVSDIRVPYATGLDLLAGLRLAATPVPVIVIDDDLTHAHAGELGAECVLDEPFDLVDLRHAVRAALAGRLPDPPGDLDHHVV